MNIFRLNNFVYYIMIQNNGNTQTRRTIDPMIKI